MHQRRTGHQPLHGRFGLAAGLYPCRHAVVSQPLDGQQVRVQIVRGLVQIDQPVRGSVEHGMQGIEASVQARQVHLDGAESVHWHALRTPISLDLGPPRWRRGRENRRWRQAGRNHGLENRGTLRGLAGRLAGRRRR